MSDLEMYQAIADGKRQRGVLSGGLIIDRVDDNTLCARYKRGEIGLEKWFWLLKNAPKGWGVADEQSNCVMIRRDSSEWSA